MLAAGVSEDEGEAYLRDVQGGTGARVVVACVNSPSSITLSGDAEVITKLEAAITRDGKFARRLRVSTAYHSPHMKDVAQGCLDAMHSVGLSQPVATMTPMFSSVTGQRIHHEEIDESYWIRNMCQPVRFSDAVANLFVKAEPSGKRKHRRRVENWASIVEIGPHSALKAPVTQIYQHIDSSGQTRTPAYVSVLVRGQHAVQTALGTAGTLWALGRQVDLAKVNLEAEAARKPRLTTELPPYPWNHTRKYWHETSATSSQRLRQLPRLELLGERVASANVLEPQWKNTLRISESPWIDDHVITGTTLYPGAGMLTMVIEAAKQIASQEGHSIGGVEFEDVSFERGLVVPREGAVETLLNIRSARPKSHEREFVILSKSDDGAWTRHCSGHFIILVDHPGSEETTPADWNLKVDEFVKTKELPWIDVDVSRLYKDLRSVGMEYGEMFQNLITLSVSPESGSCAGDVVSSHFKFYAASSLRIYPCQHFKVCFKSLILVLRKYPIQNLSCLINLSTTT